MLDTQRLVPSAAALRPSRVVANFQVTNGRPCSTREGPDPCSEVRDSTARSPDSTSTPAARSVSAPPAAAGLGSAWANTTRRTPAATSACAHGPVRPVWLQGSSVTTAVVPRGPAPARAERVGLGVRRARPAVVALGDGRAVVVEQDAADAGVGPERHAGGRREHEGAPHRGLLGGGAAHAGPLMSDRGLRGWTGRTRTTYGDGHLRALPIRTFTVGPGVSPGQPVTGCDRVADFDLSISHRRLGITPTPEHAS